MSLDHLKEPKRMWLASLKCRFGPDADVVIIMANSEEDARKMAEIAITDSAFTLDDLIFQELNISVPFARLVYHGI